MKDSVELRQNPFYLDEEAVAWVYNTLKEMTLEEKIGQLFCPIGLTEDEDELKRKYLSYKIGGMMFREGNSGVEMALRHDFLQRNSKIPLLLAANLENGGCGIAKDGTRYGSQMLVAATDSLKRAYELGWISGREGTACGCNWAFAPVVDIDINYHNPITNVRSYGSDFKRVQTMAGEFIKGIRDSRMAVAVKHFPGDGVDERDQHIVVSVNSLSCEEWDCTYGEIYKNLIEQGTQTIMVGHIAQPAWQKKLNPNTKGIVPASQSPELLQGLLRKQLGFNGVITTDATQMIGFCSTMSRRIAVPYAIESGCDIFLFNRSLEEDFHFMLEGYKDGILSKERLEQAVIRILALKASLGLHKGVALHSKTEIVQILGDKRHKRLAQECAKEGITLVKDTQQLLPISSQRYPRVLLEVMTNTDKQTILEEQFLTLLVKEGFQVETYRNESSDMVFHEGRTIDFKTQYDLVLYVMDYENQSNHTTCRLQWNSVYASDNQPWFVCEVPTVMVSLANPYHLLDAPMIKTYINAYYNSEYTRQAVIDKMLGRSTFSGINPIDPFCGREDTRY